MSITRRQFLKGTVAGACAAPFVLSTRAGAAEATRPNILFIYTDDQAPWTIAALGDPNPVTPHLDQFFRESVVCENAFATTPVCTPARVALLSSRYGTDVGITDYLSEDEPDLGLPADNPSWVRQLQEAGYHTGLVGKWHLGVQDQFHPTKFGYEYFAGFREGGTVVKDPELEIEGKKTQMHGLTVDIHTDLAIDFIRKARKPFALSVHYRSPHRPWLPVSQEDEAAIKDRKLEIPDKDYPDLDLERAQQSLTEYLESVAGVDRNVGRLLALLKKRGLAENTIVIFSSDHGYNVGHHGLLFKGNAYWLTRQATRMQKAGESITRPNLFDTSLRVPLAVRWPARFQAGRRVNRCVTNLDFFPTILAMAGVAMPEDDRVRGRNFFPLLEGREIDWNDNFYGQYSIHHNADALLRMYRTPEWKLIRDFKNVNRNELYHLGQDPDERMNLIDQPIAWQAYPELNAALLAAMKQANDPVWSEALV